MYAKGTTNILIIFFCVQPYLWLELFLSLFVHIQHI